MKEATKWTKFIDKMPENGQIILVSNGSDFSIEMHEYSSDSDLHDHFVSWSLGESMVAKYTGEDAEIVTTSITLDDGTIWNNKMSKGDRRDFFKPSPTIYYSNFGLLIPQDSPSSDGSLQYRKYDDE